MALVPEDRVGMRYLYETPNDPVGLEIF